MEWVETTGRTVEDAKEAALDRLGVDESDAEFEVVEEARAGLFGRLRSEARVRARVRPTAPRAKDDRRDRRRRSRATGEGRDASAPTAGAEPGPASGAADTAPAAAGSASPGSPESAPASVPSTGRETAAREGAPASSGIAETAAKEAAADASPAGRGGRDGRGQRGSPGPGQPTQGSPDRNQDEEREGANVEVALDEQGRIAQEFLTQLVAEFGLDADIDVVRPDDDTVDLELEGSDLGLLIGPHGATLLALQDLTRTVVHHRTGAGNGRIHVDVGGYRRKRTDALARFAQQVAATVQASGARTVLEPMTAADRKVVHDAITPIDGVSTISEGEEPQRRVVVVPANG